MVKVYSTDRMEEALKRMLAVNRNVVVYWNYKAVKPIRCRLNMVTADGPRLEMAHAWKPEMQATVDRWTLRGGGLIWKPHPLVYKAPAPACDAMLLVECPFQIDRFNATIEHVKQEVVVYRPPTWQLHNETIEYLFPSKDTYVTLEAIAKALVGRELTEEMQGVLTACKYPVATTAAFTGWDIEQLTGWSEKFLKLAMFRRYMYHSGRWHIYSLRFPPDDEDLLWAYNIIRAQPEVSRKTHAMRLDMPAGPFVPGFKRMLRQLLRGSYIVREDSIYVLNTAHPPMDHDKVDAVNNMYRGRFFKMKALIDDAEEYPI